MRELNIKKKIASTFETTTMRLSLEIESATVPGVKNFHRETPGISIGMIRGNEKQIRSNRVKSRARVCLEYLLRARVRYFPSLDARCLFNVNVTITTTTLEIERQRGIEGYGPSRERLC